jgi:ketosteroid isomerase-like protein
MVVLLLSLAVLSSVARGKRTSTIHIETITAILESAREAWNAGSIEGVLDKYVDDVVYITNTGGPNGESLTIRGKENLRRHFKAAVDVVDCQSRLEAVRYEGGLVRTRVSVDLCHRASGHSMTCSLRQILRFEGFRIAESRDFHDAAKLAAFWRLVGDPIQRRTQPVLV